MCGIHSDPWRMERGEEAQRQDFANMQQMWKRTRNPQAQVLGMLREQKHQNGRRNAVAKTMRTGQGPMGK